MPSYNPPLVIYFTLGGMVPTRTSGRILSILLLAAALGLCAPHAASQPKPELVMREGTAITATTAGGAITVTAGKKLDRRYKWRKCELDAKMAARVSRWMGKLGIYDPAPSFGLGSYLACEGISRTVVEEAQVHFDSDAAAATWLSRYATIWPKDTVWTSDGLVVSWAVVPRRDQLNADVLQLCVNGQTPKNLPGASDSKIAVVGDRRPCVSVGRAVYDETQATWGKHWQQADEWRARAEARKKAKD